MKLEYNQPNSNRPQYVQILLIALTILGFESISFIAAGYGQTISIIYRAIYVVICVFVIIKNWIKVKDKPKLTVSICVILLYWFLYLNKALFNTLFNVKYSGGELVTYWIFVFLLSVLPIFSLYTVINRRTLNYAQNLVFALAIGINIISLKNNLTMSSDTIVTRFTANEILNPITFGQTGVILVILSLLSLINQKRVYKYINVIFIIIGLINIGYSNSRSPFIELILVLIFYLGFNIKKEWILRLVLILLPIISILIYFSDYLILFNNVLDRISGTSGDEERPLIYAESWGRFISNPLIGTNAITEYAHNIFLASLEALGVMGGILMLIIYINAIKASIKLVRIKSTDWIALLVIMQLVAVLVTGAIWNIFIFWSLLALLANLYNMRYLYSDI
jgi:hypothetical protein